MPRKKPWTTTPTGTLTPKARKLAQRIAMLAAQKPIAPATREPAARRMADQVEGRPQPDASGRRDRGQPPGAARRAGGPGRSAAMRRSMSCGISAISRSPGRSRSPRSPPGRSSPRPSSRRCSTPVRSRTPQTISASVYQMYEAAEEGDHPARRLAPRHPRLAQRPVGERRCRRRRRRRRSGSPPGPPCDLVGLAPGERQHVAADDAAKQRHVGGEGRRRSKATATASQTGSASPSLLVASPSPTSFGRRT